MIYLVMHWGNTDENDTVEYVGSTPESAKGYVDTKAAEVCEHDKHTVAWWTPEKCTLRKQRWAADLDVVPWELDVIDGKRWD